MVTIYYARCIQLYNTPQDSRDLVTLKKLGFTVVNPAKDFDLQKGYATKGMKVFTDRIKDNDIAAIVFRALPDTSISAGVAEEITTALEHGKMIIEFPCAINRRTLTIEQTREYLRDVGQR